MHRRKTAKLFTLRSLIAAAMLAAQVPAGVVWAQPAPRLPDGLAHRRATIMSEGSRLTADLYAPAEPAAEKLPTLILSHGWGGTAALLRPEALAFAKAGFLVITFDYRGWGASEGRVILTGPAPADRSTGPFQAEVIEIREVVDPLEQTTDLLNVLAWARGEPQCDSARIGLWGSSYSGGHVVYAAARDPHVRALVSQVPALDSRWVIAAPSERELTEMEMTRRARGEIGYPEPGARVIGNLRGAPIRGHLADYAPVDDVERASQCAMLFVLAEKEELFDNKDHGLKAHERAQGPKKLVIVPGITHYGIYLEARAQAQQLALEWFRQHLMPAAERG